VLCIAVACVNISEFLDTLTFCSFYFFVFMTEELLLFHDPWFWILKLL